MSSGVRNVENLLVRYEVRDSERDAERRRVRCNDPRR